MTSTQSARLGTFEIAARARAIRVVAFDVDGVCTDGRLYYGDAGEALHAFHARDGLGIVRAHRAGLVLCAITGRTSKHVAARMAELRVPHVLQGIGDKEAALRGVLDSVGATFAEAAFIGDDVNDLPALVRVGLAVSVPDAAPDVLPHVHHVTTARGGQGALRELLELVMKAQGKWP